MRLETGGHPLEVGAWSSSDRGLPKTGLWTCLGKPGNLVQYVSVLPMWSRLLAGVVRQIHSAG